MQDGNSELLTSETAAFIEALRAAVNDLASKEETRNGKAEDEDKSYLREKLLAVKTACYDYDVKTANAAITQLREKSWSQSTHNLLAAIAKYLLSSDFDEIAEVVDKYFESN